MEPVKVQIEPAKVKERAYRFLSRRDHGIAELTFKLISKGADAAIVDSVIQHLIELNYLDDDRYAAGFARDRIKFKKCGPLRIRAELRARGVKNNIIERAIEQQMGDIDPVLLVEQALKSRLQSAPTGDNRRWLKKQYDFLARRGFEPETIWQVLGKLKDCD